jgi:hypothetical protein
VSTDHFQERVVLGGSLSFKTIQVIWAATVGTSCLGFSEGEDALSCFKCPVCDTFT